MPLKDDVLARDPLLTVLSVVAVTIFTAIFMLCCLLEHNGQIQKVYLLVLV